MTEEKQERGFFASLLRIPFDIGWAAGKEAREVVDKELSEEGDKNGEEEKD